MFLIQMTGLSGAGKTTIAQEVKQLLTDLGYPVELIDGDEYRQHLCRDLGFSKADRLENIRRLGFVGHSLAKHGVITILAAINPYEEARQALRIQYQYTRTVFVDCPIEILEQRDVKGLYRRARLPESDSAHIGHFTGISDPYEAPARPDFVLQTQAEQPAKSALKLLGFILEELRRERENKPVPPPRALFIGRWQPFHNGHKWLIDCKLAAGIPVLIAVRDLPQDEKNPFSTEQSVAMIRRVYQGKPVEVITIPDIESVNYGRGVGYQVNCFEPPADIYAISATMIREGVHGGDDAWKAFVDEEIHELVIACLSVKSARNKNVVQ